jgi:uncharacterized membrane protein YeaQ/YmgE (transglycosylase-associated protein family)
VTLILGIAGAFVGTFIGHVLGFYGPGHAAGFIMSVIGAMVILGLYRLFTRGRPAG